MADMYVWSGSLTGVRVSGAVTAREAVIAAIDLASPCMVGGTIRVTQRLLGRSRMDVTFLAPYEDDFPELFDGSLDVIVGTVGNSC